MYTQRATTRTCVRAGTHASKIKIWGVCTGPVRTANIKQGKIVVHFHLFRSVSSDCCWSYAINSKWMLQIYNGKFALLLLLKETSPAVLSSSSMWLHSLKKDRETHGEYVFIFIGMRYHIYLNMLLYLLDCYHIYWNVIIFIGICHHIYLLLKSNSDKNYIQNITCVKFLWGIFPNNSKNIDK